MRQGILFQVTVFYDSTLLLEEGNKCFELNKIYDIVHEQQFALPEDLNGTAMYQKLDHGVVTHEKALKSNAKGETQTMNATFERKSDFDFEINPFEETFPSH